MSDQQLLEKTINKYSLPVGPASNFPDFKLKSKKTISIHSKEVRSAELTMVIQAPELVAQNAIAEDLALNCLGAGETSPLYKNLVINSSIANSASTSTMLYGQRRTSFTPSSMSLRKFFKDARYSL